ELRATRVHVDALLKATDVVRGLLEDLDGKGFRPEDIAALCAELTGLAANVNGGAAVAAAAPALKSETGRTLRIALVPHPEAYEVGVDPLLVARELRGLASE